MQSSPSSCKGVVQSTCKKCRHGRNRWTSPQGTVSERSSANCASSETCMLVCELIMVSSDHVPRLNRTNEVQITVSKFQILIFLIDSHISEIQMWFLKFTMHNLKWGLTFRLSKILFTNGSSKIKFNSLFLKFNCYFWNAILTFEIHFAIFEIHARTFRVSKIYFSNARSIRSSIFDFLSSTVVFEIHFPYYKNQFLSLKTMWRLLKYSWKWWL